MICAYAYLRRYSMAFLKVTGLRLNEFAAQTRLHRTTAVAPAGLRGSRLGAEGQRLAAQALAPLARIMIARPGESFAR
jgi:hypothetical protein